MDILRFALSSSDRDRTAVAAVVKRDKRSMSASSEESMGSWSHITPEDDPHEETSSFIHLSEGSVTAALLILLQTLLLTPSPRSHWSIATNCSPVPMPIYSLPLQYPHLLMQCMARELALQSQWCKSSYIMDQKASS